MSRTHFHLCKGVGPLSVQLETRAEREDERVGELFFHLLLVPSLWPFVLRLLHCALVVTAEKEACAHFLRARWRYVLAPALLRERLQRNK